MPIPVAARSKERACSRSLAGIDGSNPNWGMDVCICCVLSGSGLRRTDHAHGIVLPSVVCLSVIMKLRKWGEVVPLEAVAPRKKKWRKQ